MGNIYTHIVCLLAGALIMYWLKDNLAKPDNQVNISLKKNKLFNKKEKRKVFNVFRKKDNKV